MNSFKKGKKLLTSKKASLAHKDPLITWRKRHARQFFSWNPTKIIRQMRDLRKLVKI